MRVEIHVRPNASDTVVGGTHGGALVVRVKEPAHQGRATEAALRAVADALMVPRRCVTVVRGGTSRKKLIEIDAPGSGRDFADNRLSELLGRHPE